jgi:hypothetical protein
MRRSRQVTLSLDPAILEKLDAERGLIPRSRYIAFIIEKWFAKKDGEEEAEAPEAPPSQEVEPQRR